MSTTETPVDVDVLRREIRETYTEVSTKQEKELSFPTGRAWAQELGYPEPELSPPGIRRTDLQEHDLSIPARIGHPEPRRAWPGGAGGSTLASG